MGRACRRCGSDRSDCPTCQTRRRVARLRCRRAAASQHQGPAVEYCWNCGWLVDQARLRVLTARRSRFTSCGLKCHRSLRQQLRRRRLRGLTVELPPVIVDGRRLAWGVHDLRSCPASGSVIGQLRRDTGLGTMEALLRYLARNERLAICNNCALNSVLVIGLRQRNRSRIRLLQGDRTRYRFRSGRVR
jgi:hypothetical protein